MIVVYAILIDLIIGDPFGMFHPVVFIGNTISFVKKITYKDNKISGLILVVAVLVVVLFVLELLLLFEPTRYALSLYLMYAFIATRSLYLESKKVLDHIGNIDEARKYLSYIVGRDTSTLDQQEVIKATIETVAENTIDGIIAPIFYLTLGYLLGYPLEFLVVYKTVNTLDSMVGYKNDKYKNFGYVSAKLDDLLNLIPARIGSIIMLIAGWFSGFDFIRGCKTYNQDRYAHSSPNAGHPESVVAGLLGIRLGGPSIYFDNIVDKPYIGKTYNQISEVSLQNTYKIMFVSVVITTIIVAVLLGG